VQSILRLHSCLCELQVLFKLALSDNSSSSKNHSASDLCTDACNQAQVACPRMQQCSRALAASAAQLTIRPKLPELLLAMQCMHDA
jgi:hypothetical protein